MIRIPLPWLMILYVAIFLAAVFVAWAAHEFSRRRGEKLALRNRRRCALCAMEYDDPSSDSLTRCPRCGSLNER